MHVQAAQLCLVSKPEPLLVLMGHPVRQPQVAAILRGLHAPISWVSASGLWLSTGPSLTFLCTMQPPDKI